MPTPTERAEYLYAQLKQLDPEPTQWDLVCFSAWMLGALSHAEPALEDVAQAVVQRVALINMTHNMNEIASCLTQVQPLESKTPLPTEPTDNSTPT